MESNDICSIQLLKWYLIFLVCFYLFLSLVAYIPHVNIFIVVSWCWRKKSETSWASGLLIHWIVASKIMTCTHAVCRFSFEIVFNDLIFILLLLLANFNIHKCLCYTLQINTAYKFSLIHIDWMQTFNWKRKLHHSTPRKKNKKNPMQKQKISRKHRNHSVAVQLNRKRWTTKKGWIFIVWWTLPAIMPVRWRWNWL